MAIKIVVRYCQRIIFIINVNEIDDKNIGTYCANLIKIVLVIIRKSLKIINCF